MRLNSNGQASYEITNLLAIFAGGAHSARKFLKIEMGNTNTQFRCFFGIGSIFLIASSLLTWYIYQKAKDEKEMLAALEHSQLEINKIPSVRADEMGTHCLICLSNPSNVVLIPCNHLCICNDCFQQYQNTERRNIAWSSIKCPMCRLPVDLNQQILIVYN